MASRGLDQDGSEGGDPGLAVREPCATIRRRDIIVASDSVRSVVLNHIVISRSAFAGASFHANRRTKGLPAGVSGGSDGRRGFAEATSGLLSDLVKGSDYRSVIPDYKFLAP